MDKAFLELLDRYAPAIRDAVIEGIRNIRDNALLNQIIEMVERDDVEGALRALGYNPAVFNGVYLAMMQTFEAGGLLMVSTMPKYATTSDGMKTMFRFNVRDPRVEKWLQDESSKLITDIEDDVRQSVRDTLRLGAAEGRNPRKVALDLVGRYDRSTGHREGGTVGLGTRERYWANNARVKLQSLDESYFNLKLRDARFDGTVRKAIAEGRPLPESTVDKLVDRYRAKALQYRGEMIGRTEALAALNRSEFDATRQALDQSELPVAAAKKVWDDTGDSHVRPSHRALAAMGPIGIDEPFVSPVTGGRMMYPGDTSLGAGGEDVIACRCRVRYEIDYLYRYRNGPG